MLLSRCDVHHWQQLLTNQVASDIWTVLQVPHTWTFLTEILGVLETKVTNSFSEQLLLNKRQCPWPFLDKKQRQQQGAFQQPSKPSSLIICPSSTIKVQLVSISDSMANFFSFTFFIICWYPEVHIGILLNEYHTFLDFFFWCKNGCDSCALAFLHFVIYKQPSLPHAFFLSRN